MNLDAKDDICYHFINKKTILLLDIKQASTCSSQGEVNSDQLLPEELESLW